MPSRSPAACVPADSNLQSSEIEPMHATHGPLHVVATTSIQSIDLETWARRYALAVIAVHLADDGSQAA